MSIFTVISISFFAFLIYFWWQSDAKKKIALDAVDAYCQSTNIQFLDQSIWLSKVWPTRHQTGKLRFVRHYQFEFTSTGQSRYRGLIVMSGSKIEKLEVEPHIYPMDK